VGRALRLWGPVLAWMAAIFAASAQSDLGTAGRVPDWASHGSAYFALGLLCCRGLAGGFGRPLSWAQAGLAIALCTAYGVSDELHQALVPGRDASGFDVVKDFGGSALAALAYRRLAAAGRQEDALR
jgi:VanZ family protein